MSELILNDYIELFNDVKARIRSAQYSALKAVNRELIGLYWDIGKAIVERQTDEGFGRAVVERLSRDLQVEFPGIAGFSVSNLWRMRLFFQTYPTSSKLAPIVREIGWSHNIVILERCKDDLEREFYLQMARRYGWTKNVILHHIENNTYEKTLVNQTSFDRTLPESTRDQAKLAVKDEYIFDFLELADEHSELQLKRAILARVEPFLREIGGLFAFIGSEFRLAVGDRDFFVDLLLFHRRLKCLVAVELKVSEFQPEHLGKMQFYLAALDDLVRLPDENPSIGIILCKLKDRLVVEYALRDASRPVGVAGYKVLSCLPEELRGQLPAPEDIELLLKEIER